MALKDHYEGVDVHTVNTVQADKVLNGLFYSGENKPHMWWDGFERQITDEFNTCGRLKKRSIHSNGMRLRILNRNILADLLQATKSSINLESAKTPVTIAYENTLAAFCNQVNHKFPPELSSSNNRKTRIINEAGTHGGGIGGIFQDQGGRYQGCGGRGISGGRGRGTSGRGHGGRGNHRLSIQDSQMVRYNDG